MKTYDPTPKAPIESRFKRWIYSPKIIEHRATLSDGTTYSVDPISGMWRRLTQKRSQRKIRRLMGAIRRRMKLTRSQYDRLHQNPQVPKGE